MKKKTYYQTNVFWQLLCCVVLAFVIGGIVLVVITLIPCFSGELQQAQLVRAILLAVIYSIGVGLFIKEFIRMEHNNIHLDNEKIYMKDDWSIILEKIQFHTEVKFADISSIDIIYSKNNSRGGRIRSPLPSSRVEKPYLSITTIDNKTYNFFIMYITKKNRKRLIEDIKERMRQAGNNALEQNSLK